MAWTTPMTFVDATALNAADLNTHLRDNLNETMPGKAVYAGSMFVVNSTGPIALAERQLATASLGQSESTASTSYVDLATVGPTVTETTGTRAMVSISTRMYNNTNNALCAMSYAVSGATTLAAADSSMVAIDGVQTANRWHVGVCDFLSSLTAGDNTFTAKYRAGGAGTAYFGYRRIVLWPL